MSSTPAWTTHSDTVVVMIGLPSVVLGISGVPGQAVGSNPSSVK